MQLSISSVEKTVASESGSVVVASVVAPAVSGFWKRVQWSEQDVCSNFKHYRCGNFLSAFNVSQLADLASPAIVWISAPGCC